MRAAWWGPMEQSTCQRSLQSGGRIYTRRDALLVLSAHEMQSDSGMGVAPASRRTARDPTKNRATGGVTRGLRTETPAVRGFRAGAAHRARDRDAPSRQA